MKLKPFVRLIDYSVRYTFEMTCSECGEIDHEGFVRCEVCGFVSKFYTECGCMDNDFYTRAYAESRIRTHLLQHMWKERYNPQSDEANEAYLWLEKRVLESFEKYPRFSVGAPRPRKKSQKEAEERYFEWAMAECARIEARVRGYFRTLGFVDEGLQTDGRCVMSVIASFRNDSEESLKQALSYFRRNMKPYM